MRVRLSIGIAAIALSVAACGGGGGGATTPATSTMDPVPSAGTASAAGACPNITYSRPDVAGAAPFSAGSIWVTDATTKIRPNDVLGSTPLGQIEAARNEHEMFQVLVRNTANSLRVTDVHFALPTLPSAGLSEVERVMIYRAGYMNVVTPSNSEGAIGAWPDALIPVIDNYACESRNALPIDVGTGRNQAFYVDVYVPRRTPPGSYAGTLTIKGIENPGTTRARTVAWTQNIDFKVWNFTLPSTASLQTQFGFVGSALGTGHGTTFARADLRRLSYLYALAGLRNRIAITSGLADAPPYTYQDGVVRIDWTELDQDLAPFLDGTALHNGAKWAAVDVRPFSPPIYRTDGATGLTAYYKAYADHFRARGWLDKLWGYTRDEPTADQYVEVKERAQAMRAADPKLRPLVTKGLVDGLRDTPQTSAMGIWAPLVNQMDDATRAQYDAYLSAGAELWWYQSCESHGCWSNDVTGYPSYMIDIPGAYNRIMPWLAFRYRVGGELYFNTMEAYYRLPDAWTSQFLFSGNGDGTLFYPGRPDKIGGRTHIPIESLRLKLIREGQEDYEYLRLVASRDATYAGQQVQNVARGVRDFAHNAGPFYAARHALGERLAALVASGALRDNETGE
jgi:hypothetical protein